MKVVVAEYDVVLKFSGPPLTMGNLTIEGGRGYHFTVRAGSPAQAIREALIHGPGGMVESVTSVEVS